MGPLPHRHVTAGPVNRPPMPGKILLEILKARSVSQASLARLMDRPLKTINEIIKGKTRITEDTAIQLENVFEISASYWLMLEVFYRLDSARTGGN